jgi:small subunit ribosomal protein S4
MGDPRKNRRTYSRPKKPWDKARLDAEAIIVREYGVANKTELYKMESLLRKFAFQAKKLLTSRSQQAEQEQKALLSKLHSFALTSANAQLDDVLALQLKNVMERRLQTLVLRKGLANTVKQARQFIVHRHIKVGDKIITSPSYIATKDEESKITFVEKSPLASPDHPERPEQIFKAKEALKKPKKEALPEPVAAPVEVKKE